MAANTIDLSRINQGNWQFICVIGAYNDPAQILRQEARGRGIIIKHVEPVTTKFLGLSPVEESEGAIAFVDQSGVGRTILIDGFERLVGQHGRSCFGPETKEIVLPL